MTETTTAQPRHRPDWDTYFLQMCFAVMQRSEDPSTQVGAVIVGPGHEVLSVGYNSLPRGVESTPEKWGRPQKYENVLHAEHNAILNAARTGTAIDGATLYMPYDCLPCKGCCNVIVQAGIAELVLGHVPFPGKGKGTHYDVESEAAAVLGDRVKIRRVGPR